MPISRDALEKRIGVNFEDKALLDEALTHRSYLNEHSEWEGAHNERLEFLGDAVLELVVTEHLYKEFPKAQEGKMTNLRAALVRTETLALIGADLQLIDAMRLSRGEAKDSGRAREAILANVMEALIGATFLDQGIASAKEFIQNFVIVRLPEVISGKKVRDAKSRFQEQAQAHAGTTPHYKVIKEWGPDHSRHFDIGAYIGEELVGEGKGASKQAAQQVAAQDALNKKGWEKES